PMSLHAARRSAGPAAPAICTLSLHDALPISRGSVTPIAKTYTGDNGRTCRDFLASYVNGKTERWLQGSACRIERGRWDIRTLKPDRKSTRLHSSHLVTSYAVFCLKK